MLISGRLGFMAGRTPKWTWTTATVLGAAPTPVIRDNMFTDVTGTLVAMIGAVNTIVISNNSGVNFLVTITCPANIKIAYFANGGSDLMVFALDGKTYRSNNFTSNNTMTQYNSGSIGASATLDTTLYTSGYEYALISNTLYYASGAGAGSLTNLVTGAGSVSCIDPVNDIPGAALVFCSGGVNAYNTQNGSGTATAKGSWSGVTSPVGKIKAFTDLTAAGFVMMVDGANATFRASQGGGVASPASALGLPSNFIMYDCRVNHAWNYMIMSGTSGGVSKVYSSFDYGYSWREEPLPGLTGRNYQITINKSLVQTSPAVAYACGFALSDPLYKATFS